MKSTPATRRGKRVRPEMNVTPLVDVVLVLLIIFMVVAPMLEHAAPVDLPSIMNIDAERHGRTDPITVSLTRQGALYLEQEELAPDVLDRRLRDVHEKEPRRRIVLRGDRGVKYVEARRLFKRCQEIGFRGVSFIVGSRSEDAKLASRGAGH